jgi:3-oxoacyl-[acyl-carrier-protein] synthase-1
MDVLAWIIAAATTMEKNRIKTDDICIGEGLSETISNVSSSLKLPEEKINATYCDLNGERYRSEEFMFTALRSQLAFVNILDNLTPTDCGGDAGAASGPLFAALAIASGLRGYAQGPRSLLWAGSESGQRSAVLLHIATRLSG